MSTLLHLHHARAAQARSRFAKWFEPTPEEQRNDLQLRKSAPLLTWARAVDTLFFIACAGLVACVAWIVLS